MHFREPEIATLGNENMNIIKHDELKTLVAETGVKTVQGIGTTGGFLLQVTTKAGNDVLLHTKLEKPRIFKRSDALLSYMRNELGIGRVTVSLERWEQDQQAII